MMRVMETDSDIATGSEAKPLAMSRTSAGATSTPITGTPIGSFRCRSEQLMGQLEAELDFTSVAGIITSGLHEYLDGLQMKMNALDVSLRDDFAVSTRPPSGRT